jgi:superfamily II helicase
MEYLERAANEFKILDLYLVGRHEEANKLKESIKNRLDIEIIINGEYEHKPQLIRLRDYYRISVFAYIEHIIKEEEESEEKLLSLIEANNQCDCEDCDKAKRSQSLGDDIVMNAVEKKDVKIMNIGYKLGGRWLAEDYMEDIDDEVQIGCFKFIYNNIYDKQIFINEFNAHVNKLMFKLKNDKIAILDKICESLSQF